MMRPSMGRKVAVIGAGIAGMGAAWALHRAGIEVAVFERRGVLGGNAKVHRWSTNGRAVETGLSVLAWPKELFFNYSRLLAELGVRTQPTGPLRCFVTSGEQVWAQGSGAHAEQLERWERMVRWVRWFNGRIDGEEPSLYRVAADNPLAFVPLRWLSRRFGLDDAFWEEVVVPVHSASFLTVELDSLPALILPTIESIVSLRHGASLQTWSGTSAEVFTRLARGFEERIALSCEIERVERGARVRVESDRGRWEGDAVVFACPAPAALAMLAAPSPLERALLGTVRYVERRDPTFLVGRVHRDASVLPDAHRQAILRGYANHIHCARDAHGRRYSNTFVLSSWVPAARRETRPMLVSYNYDGPIAGVEAEVSNARAHPELSPSNLTRAMLLRWLQGRRRTWYCGSWTTPGNGHDLSLLSGLVVADALGAAYPFADTPRARRDFEALRRFMRGAHALRG